MRYLYALTFEHFDRRLIWTYRMKVTAKSLDNATKGKTELFTNWPMEIDCHKVKIYYHQKDFTTDFQK